MPGKTAPPTHKSKSKKETEEPAPDFEDISDSGENEDTSKESSEPDSSLCSLASLAGLKVMLILFILMLVVLSDFFVDRVMSNFGGLVDQTTPTNLGVLSQDLCVCLMFIAGWYLVRANII